MNMLSCHRPGKRVFAKGLVALCLLGGLVGRAAAALPIESWRAPSGAKVMFVRAPGIPMLDVRVDFDAGGRFDPADKSGLAALTQGMLAKGAQGLDESAIEERFADVGALLGGGAGDDRASMSLRTLTSKAELDTSIDLLGRILASPQFPQDVFERERQRLLQAVREAEVRPDAIAQRAFGRLMYGSHPYGFDPTVATLSKVGRDDLVAFYRAHYAAKRAVVSMVGDVDRAQAEAIAERLTRQLPPATGEPSVAPVQLPAKAVEQRIPHSASQSHILIGVPSIARGDPDFFPLLVGNYVLGGGGFVSRLYSEVREKRGLVYSVGSYFRPELQLGPFTIALQTKKEQTDLALEVVRDTLRRFMTDGPTAAELQAAKDNMIGGFPLRIDSNGKILENIALIGFYGLPTDYLDTWTGRIAAVTADQVKAAFARHVPQDRLVTVVVGATTAIGSGPAPAPATSAASAASANSPGTSGAPAVVAPAPSVAAAVR